MLWVAQLDTLNSRKDHAVFHDTRPRRIAAIIGWMGIFILTAAAVASAHDPDGAGRFIDDFACATVVIPVVCGLAKFLAFRARLGAAAASRTVLVSFFEPVIFVALILVVLETSIDPWWVLLAAYPPAGLLVNLLLVQDRRQKPSPSVWRGGRPFLALAISLPMPILHLVLTYGLFDLAQ